MCIVVVNFHIEKKQTRTWVERSGSKGCPPTCLARSCLAGLNGVPHYSNGRLTSVSLPVLLTAELPAKEKAERYKTDTLNSHWRLPVTSCPRCSALTMILKWKYLLKGGIKFSGHFSLHAFKALRGEEGVTATQSQETEPQAVVARSRLVTEKRAI